MKFKGFLTKAAAGLLLALAVYSLGLGLSGSPKGLCVKAGGLPVLQMGLGFPGQEPKMAFGPGASNLGGGSLTLLSNQTASQMLSVVMETKEGSLIVVDGGTKGDAAHLSNMIRSKGGRVAAWFITHPHSDHVGALIQILNDPNSQIAIDQVYYSLADQSWYQSREGYRADMVQQFRDALGKLPPERLHGHLRKGQKIWIDDVKATVMNDIYLLDHNSINNSSIAYRFAMNGVGILFLGDMGQEAGNRLLEETPPDFLRSDIVQMAHHGQHGVSRQVYEAIKPKICLWPTPGWLWNNDNGGGEGSGPWSTLETRRWMKELGVVADYVIKDGDQVIR